MNHFPIVFEENLFQTRSQTRECGLLWCLYAKITQCHPFTQGAELLSKVILYSLP